eukprot:3516795-Pyramimonas_sp.AAC.1
MIASRCGAERPVPRRLRTALPIAPRSASGEIRIRSANLRPAATSGSTIALARARSPRFARVLFERARCA